MIFWTTFVNYMLRVNMSISIVAMVKPTGGKILTPECLNTTISKNATLPDMGPRHAWSQNVQGLILGGYFYGFIISSVIAGPIAEMLGPWKSTLITSIAQGVFNSLTPIGARIHYSAVFLARFLIGLNGGIAYPAIQVLIAKWAPPAEKGKFTSMLMGNTIGTVVTWPLVGQITASVNWEWGFHVLTIIQAAYCVAFFFLVADSPDKHLFISEEEKEYIAASQLGVSKKKSLPPYKRILTSLAFWSLTITQFGNLWGLFLLVTGAPKFLVEVMGFDIKASGFLAALPYLSRFFGGTIFGWINDAIRASGKLKPMNIRRVATVFSHILPGTGLICIMTVGCNAVVVVALMVIALGLNGAVIMGHLQNPQDLAPNFAGTLYGWMMFFGGATGFIVPAISGAIIQKHNGINEWHTIFLIGGCAYIACGIFFMIFGSASLQPWNEIRDDGEGDEENQDK